MNWTQEEIQFLKDNRQELTTRELSLAINKPMHYIKNKLHELGIIKKLPPIIYNIDFFKQPSRALAYFLGYHMADGYITKNLQRISILLQIVDKNVLQYFHSIIGGTLTDRIKFDKKYNKYRNYCEYNIYNKEICNILLNEYKIPQQKTANEIIPKQFKNELLPDFMRGHFDGDGSVQIADNRLRCNIVCANQEFLQYLMQYYNIGNMRTLIKNRNIPLYDWRMSSFDALKFKSIIYNNEPYALSRKKEIFASYDESCTNRFSENEIEFIKQNYSNFSNRELVKILGRNESGFSTKCKKLGLSKKKLKKFTIDECQFIKDNINKLTILEMAKILNRTYNSVYYKYNIINSNI